MHLCGAGVGETDVDSCIDAHLHNALRPCAIAIWTGILHAVSQIDVLDSIMDRVGITILTELTEIILQKKSINATRIAGLDTLLIIIKLRAAVLTLHLLGLEL